MVSPHLVGIQARWLTGGPPPIRQPTPNLQGGRPQIHDLELCIDFGAVEQVCRRVWFCFSYGHSVDGRLSSPILSKYERKMEYLCFPSRDRARRVAPGNVASVPRTSSAMVSVTLLCFRLLRDVLTMSLTCTIESIENNNAAMWVQS